MITYDVLRHACTPRVEGIYLNWKADTFYRNLDAEGVAQALKLHDRYKQEDTPLKLGLYSPAPRAMYTLAIAIAGHEIPILPLKELFTPEGPDGEVLNVGFENFNNDLPSYIADTQLFSALETFGNTAAAAIKSEVEKLGIKDGVVVVSNHAVTGNFVACALSNWKADKVCFNTQMGYADRMRVQGENVEHLPFL